MNNLAHLPPVRWKTILAFALVYISWGTTYLAIGKGVEVFPPALFGGARLATAGLIILAYIAVSRRSLRMPWRHLAWTGLIGALLFVGGNGLLTVGEMFVPSGVASVLVAVTPMFIAGLEMCWPHGERLTMAGWAGVLAGLVGVSLLLVPGLRDPAQLFQGGGPLLLLGSSFCWALGSFIVRHLKMPIDHLLAAGYQMALGGTALAMIGLAARRAPEHSCLEFQSSRRRSFFLSSGRRVADRLRRLQLAARACLGHGGGHLCVCQSSGCHSCGLASQRRTNYRLDNWRNDGDPGRRGIGARHRRPQQEPGPNDAHSG